MSWPARVGHGFLVETSRSSLKAGLDSPCSHPLGVAANFTLLTSSECGLGDRDSCFSQNGQQEEMSKGLWTQLPCAAPTSHQESRGMLSSGLRLDLPPPHPKQFFFRPGGAVRAGPPLGVILSVRAKSLQLCPTLQHYRV